MNKKWLWIAAAVGAWYWWNERQKALARAAVQAQYGPNSR